MKRKIKLTNNLEVVIEKHSEELKGDISFMFDTIKDKFFYTYTSTFKISKNIKDHVKNIFDNEIADKKEDIKAIVKYMDYNIWMHKENVAKEMINWFYN